MVENERNGARHEGAVTFVVTAVRLQDGAHGQRCDAHGPGQRAVLFLLIAQVVNARVHGALGLFTERRIHLLVRMGDARQCHEGDKRDSYGL